MFGIKQQNSLKPYDLATLLKMMNTDEQENFNDAKLSVTIGLFIWLITMISLGVVLFIFNLISFFDDGIFHLLSKLMAFSRFPLFLGGIYFFGGVFYIMYQSLVLYIRYKVLSKKKVK